MPPTPLIRAVRRTIPGYRAAAALWIAIATALPAAGTEEPARTDDKTSQPGWVETVAVSLVLVPVVVRDASGHPVTDLAREDFTVLDEGVPVALASFGREARPVSVILALDLSPSMQPHELAARAAALEFIRSQAEGTACSLVIFNEGVYLDLDFSTVRREMEDAISAARLGGDRTALFDALAASARHLDRREGARIAVVFTDGTDTVYPQEQAEAALAKGIDAALSRDVAIYTVAFGPRAARGILRRVADETGGEALVADSASNLSSAFAHVAESVGSRYLLAFRPPERAEPGYRKITVKLSRPGLRVTARSRYPAR